MKIDGSEPFEITYKNLEMYKEGESFSKEYKVNAARKSKVDDNTAKMQSIKQLGV